MTTGIIVLFAALLSSVPNINPTTARVLESRSPPDARPPDDQPGDKGQHFCCGEVDGKGGGKDCKLISSEEVSVGVCDTILYCDGSWQFVDGKAKCIPDSQG